MKEKFFIQKKLKQDKKYQTKLVTLKDIIASLKQI